MDHTHIKTHNIRKDTQVKKADLPPPPPPSPAEPKEDSRRTRPILSSEVLAALKHHPLPLAPVSLDSLADTPKTHLPRTPPPTPSIEPLDLYPASTESQAEPMEEEEPAQPFLYKSNESIPVLYEPDTTAIKKEGEFIQPQAHESRETSAPTASIYV